MINSMDFEEHNWVYLALEFSEAFLQSRVLLGKCGDSRGEKGINQTYSEYI